MNYTDGISHKSELMQINHDTSYLWSQGKCSHTHTYLQAGVYLIFYSKLCTETKLDLESEKLVRDLSNSNVSTDPVLSI